MNSRTATIAGRVLLGLLLSCTLLFASNDRYEGSFQRTLNVNGPVHLSVQTGSGSIHVRQGAANTVRVDAVIHSRYQENVNEIERNPPIRQDGNTIEIGRLPEELSRNTSVEFNIATPAATDLKATTGSGDTEVSDLDGPVRLTTGSGHVTVTSVKQEVNASTGSGDIEVNRVTGPVRLNTGSGSVRVTQAAEVRSTTGSGDVTIRDVQGRVEAETGSGAMHIEHAGNDLVAHTGSGDIEATGEMPQGSHWDLHTGSGSIRLHLPPSVATEVFAESSSGSISSSHNLTLTGQLNRHSVHGVINKPLSQLRARTGSGDINID